jgi:DNA-binding beta-propeller fold protein YncE
MIRMTTWLTVIILSCWSLPAISQDDSGKLAWPASPERARIEHVMTISSPSLFESRSGFFGKISKFLFGDEALSPWLVQPVGVAVTSKKIILVADPGAKGVHILDLAEKNYKFLASTKFGSFDSPVGIACAPDGSVFISDSRAGTIVRLNDDFDGVSVIKEHLQRPTGLCIVEDRLYVADAQQQKILCYTLDGSFVAEYGGRGSEIGLFNYPIGIAHGDSFYVVDALNYRVQMLDRSFRSGGSFGSQGNAIGRFSSPKSVAVDSDGDIYVTDALLDDFQIFDRAGQLLLAVGGKGVRDGEFLSPGGIAIDKSDRIYIVDTMNKRIQVFQYIK